MSAARLIALAAVVLGAGAGCGEDQPVTGSVDLPEYASTGQDVFAFTGRVTRGSKVTVTVRGAPRGSVVVEPSGRFSAAVGGLRRGENVVRVRATRAGRSTWRRALTVERRAGSPLVRVPREDVIPPVAVLRVAGAGSPGEVLSVSPSAPEDRPTTIRLDRPAFRATALARDAGGAGRIRLSTTYRTRCGRRWRPTHVSLPPAQIENVKLAPGTVNAVEETRTATVRLRAGRGCTVFGEAWAEATDGQGLQAVSQHVAFSYAPRP